MIFRRPRLISSLVPIEITRAITACMRCVQADPQANPKAGKRAEERAEKRAEQSVGVQARGLEKMRALNEQLGRMGRAALEIILPHGCLACDRAVGSIGSVCAACWQTIRWIDGPQCYVCGRELPFDLGHRYRCPPCSAAPPVYDAAVSAVYYEAAGRNLILRLKYGDRPEAADLMARWLMRRLTPLIGGLHDHYMIVPVPLHPLRRWHRRYNQSALIALALADISGLRVSLAAVKRRRYTRSQIGLTWRARQRNLKGAFHLTAQGQRAIANRSVILIDDVMTTGATLSACARLCRDGNAKEVIIVTVARVRGLN